MKQFPIPSGPPRDDRDRPGVPSANDDSDAATGSYAKGGMVKTACYAEGGPVYGRTRSFVKEPTEFTKVKRVEMPDPTPQAYAKGGKGKAPPDKTPKGNWKGHQ